MNSEKASINTALYVSSSVGSVGMVVLTGMVVFVTMFIVGYSFMLGDGDGASDGKMKSSHSPHDSGQFLFTTG